MNKTLIVTLSAVVALSGGQLTAATETSGGRPVASVATIYLASHPSLTRTGESFVFEWNDAIWLASTTGGVAHCLTPDGSRCASPLVSSDGRRVVFASDREGCANHLFELDLSTGESRQVSWHSEFTRPCTWGMGERDVICAVQRDHAGLHAQRLAFLSLARRAAERVPFDFEADDPSLAPDGRRLLFTRRGEPKAFRLRRNSTCVDAGEIWLYDLASKAFTPLVREKTDSRGAVWAPDGKGFYYLNGGIRNLFYRPIDARGGVGKSVRLTAFTDGHVADLAVSADGRVALFRQTFDFYRLDLTRPGAKPVRLALRPETGYRAHAATRRRVFTTCWNDFGSGSVDFCDDGRQIALIAGGELYVMDTERRQPRKVYGSSLAHARDCQFVANGRRLYFVVDAGDGTDIWYAERKEPKKAWWANRAFTCTRVTSDGAYRRGFSVSPDGRSFAWQGDGARFAFADSNGVVRARGPKDNGGGAYSWSPDGRHVVAQVSHSSFQREIAIISTVKDETSWPLTKNFGFDGSPTWSPDGAVIAWVSALPGNEGSRLCYVYLDEAQEARELGEAADAKSAKKRPVPFDRLFDNVRVTSVAAKRVFFSSDSRTLALARPGATGLQSVRLPKDLAPKPACEVAGNLNRWLRKKPNDKGLFLGTVDDLPAHGARKFAFTVHQVTDVADYREQAFRIAWGTIAHRYYDPDFHGVDWLAVRDRYLPYARNAGSLTVFQRVLMMMVGELDSSHVGCTISDRGRTNWEPRANFNGWQERTVHLGLRFDPTYQGAGWRIRDVLRGAPADRRGFGFAPGDIVEKVDGTPVSSDTDPASVLNGVADRTVRLTVKGREHEVPTIGWEKARELVGKMEIRSRRERVHELSGGRFGYLDIAAMDGPSLARFQQDAYAEGVGRDGLIIDVRTNHGGNTADKMLLSLFGNTHTYAVSRAGSADAMMGWFDRPVWCKPIVVLCGGESGSNAEMFSHAVRQSGRGKLVGRETGGNVICTSAVNILDYGTFRMPFLGMFLLDGRDMEFNGAKPDVEVDNLPDEIVRGVDRQLETAVRVLGEETAEWQRRHPKANFRFAR